MCIKYGTLSEAFETYLTKFSLKDATYQDIKTKSNI